MSRSIWKGPIIIKGIQTVEDAKIAADMGIELQKAELALRYNLDYVQDKDLNLK